MIYLLGLLGGEMIHAERLAHSLTPWKLSLCVYHRHYHIIFIISITYIPDALKQTVS